MVTITKVYTRTGDKGLTSLGDGTRVPKHSLRPTAYGEIDEANTLIGIARLHAPDGLNAILGRIQNDLFDVGGDICVPEKENPKREPLRVTAPQIEWLEEQIDATNAGLGKLRSFILPAGTPLAAHLHHARAVVRRAERSVAELMDTEEVNPQALRYLNRLSDYLFVAARRANHDAGEADVLWVAGKYRGKQP